MKSSSTPLLMLVALFSFLLSTKTATAQVATLTYPQSGNSAVDTTLPFTWTPVANAQAYYLIIGTKSGAKNIFDSGELAKTQIYLPALVGGVTLYGRLSTKWGGHWYDAPDITFQVVNGCAKFLQPTEGGRLQLPYQLQWTATKGAQAYALKIGTTLGGRDLYNGNEIQNSLQSIDTVLPFNTKLFARLYTKMNSQWAFSDISFWTPDKPAMLYPQDKEPSADTNTPFAWYAFTNATKYYLTIGTSLGKTDLFNSGETTKTNAGIPPLPANQSLFARLQVKVGGTWRANDISFQVINGKAVLLNPKDGTQNADSTLPIKWSMMQGASAYVLNIGTTQGARDLFNSGEINKDSVQPSALPVETTLFARIWTKHKNGWAFSDSQFTLAPVPVQFKTPQIPGRYLLPGADIRWTTSASIDSYRLLLGSSVGGSDYLDTGEIGSGSYPCPVLPAGVPIYARVLSHWQGAWYTTDTVLYAHSVFQYPQNGAMDVDATKTFSWSPGGTVNGVAPQYTLSIGTTPGGREVLAPTLVKGNQYSLTNLTLPKKVPLYATLLTKLGDKSVFAATSVFATSDTPKRAVSLLYPVNGEKSADVSNPFAWEESDLATGYRLEILSGKTEVRDSGVIRVPRYFASDLPIGDYTARLSVQLGGVWYVRSSSFHVSATGANVDKEMQTALWATDRVRKMGMLAYASHYYALHHTLLWNMTVLAGEGYLPVCTQFAFTLLALESEMNIGRAMNADKHPRLLIIAYIVNGFDGHTLTEYYHRGLGRWIVLDPTFGLVPLRASDGTYATKEDIQASTLKQDWNGIQYQFLGSYGDSYARSYYLDYPLLYLNIPNPTLTLPGTGNDPLPYLQSLSPPFSEVTTLLVRSQSSLVRLKLDGVLRDIPTNGVKNTSAVLRASRLENPNNTKIDLYKVLRFRF